MDMKSVIYKVLLLVLMLLFINSCKQSPTEVSNEPLQNGRWSESFKWNEGTHAEFAKAFGLNNNMQKTATLFLNGNNFVLTILPPNLVTYVNNGSAYSGLNKDTLYTGRYSTHQDTLLFILDKDSTLHYFAYHLSNDSLKISTLPKKISDSVYTVSFSEFLWGNCFNKHAGTFSKLD